MVRSFFLVAATALFSGLVAAQDAPLACAVGCVEGIYRDPSRLGCKPEDKNCACHSGQNFEFGVRDCITQACGWSGETLTAQLAAAAKYGADGCLPYTSTAAPAPATTAPPPPPPAAAPATPPPAENPPPPATSAAQNPAAPAETPANNDGGAAKPPASSEAPKASPSPEAPKPSPSPKTSDPVKPEATPTNPNQPTTTAAATNSGPSSSAASTDDSVSAASASAAPESSGTVNSQTANTDESKKDDSAGGLSVAAKAGIGAGAGVAVVMMAITACCILMRRRAQNRPKPAAGPARPARSPMPNISRPIAGGRQYAEDIESPPVAVTGFPAMAQAPSQNSSLYSPKPTFAHSDERYSVKGNRYEDMLPRTQPRTMI